MATNERPRYSDRSGALTQRLIPIRCPNGRDEKADAPVEKRINVYLLDVLLAELPGFAAACIDRALAALSLGTGAYPMSADMRMLRTEIEQQGDSLKAWIRDECELRPDAFATTDSLYSDYKSYCERGGNKSLAKERFSIAIGERHPEVKPSRHRFGGESQRSLDGIRLRLDPLVAVNEAAGIVDEPISEVLARCETAGITLRLADDGLSFSAKPASALTPELRADLKEHRAEILRSLARCDWTVDVAAPLLEAFMAEARVMLSTVDSLPVLEAIACVIRLADLAFEAQDTAALQEAIALWPEVRALSLDYIWPEVSTDTAAQAWARTPEARPAGELAL